MMSNISIPLKSTRDYKDREGGSYYDQHQQIYWKLWYRMWRLTFSKCQKIVLECGCRGTARNSLALNSLSYFALNGIWKIFANPCFAIDTILM